MNNFEGLRMQIVTLKAILGIKLVAFGLGLMPYPAAKKLISELAAVYLGGDDENGVLN